MKKELFVISKASYTAPVIKTLIVNGEGVLDTWTVDDIDEDDDDVEEPSKESLPYFNVWDD